MSTHRGWILVAAVVGIAGAVIPQVKWHGAQPPTEALSIAPAMGMPGAPPTSADGLRRRISEMEQRLRERPHDNGAAVLLADALLRQARVTSDGRLAGRAGEALKAVLKDNPAHYDALRMLGAVYLSQHRFRDAFEIAQRTRDLRPTDAWNYGLIGDALIELGDYERAFDSVDRMVSLRPHAAAYARVAYARELQGNLEGALQAMQMADEATTAHDPEAQAWYAAQVGELYLQMGKPGDADREYRRAALIFLNHPFAMVGQGKVKAARGDRDGALTIYLDQLQRTPTLDLAARIGDLYAQVGNSSEAERYYRLAEDLAGPDITQTEANLALFLVEHDRKLAQAAKIAEAVSTRRDDIFTNDALAWSYYKMGRVEEALVASQRARRTGTRDARILFHANEIRRAALTTK